MNSFYIITNDAKDPVFYYTEHVVQYLNKHRKNVKVACNKDWNKNRPGLQDEQDVNSYTYARTIPDDTECIIVLGGDGTLLQAARDIREKKIPLIGINLGTMGYLAEIEVSQIDTALSSLLEGTYTVEERMMLSGSVAGSQNAAGHALNDVVITRCGAFQIVGFDIYVNGLLLNSCRADGIVISTPTGSTGYNMSAGGPIVEPCAELIVLTPISPHTLNNRSIILAPEDEIKIVLPGVADRPQDVGVYFDGKEAVMLKNGDSVTIRKSGRTTGIIKLNQESFLTVLQKKMQ